MTIQYVLGDTIKSSDNKLTMNKIAVEGKVRPSTVSDICKGNAKSIKLDTLDSILNAMNRINTSVTYDISDIIRYNYNEK